MVPEGEYVVEFIGTGSNCAMQFGWPTLMENRVRVLVRDGYLSYASVLCE